MKKESWWAFWSMEQQGDENGPLTWGALKELCLIFSSIFPEYVEWYNIIHIVLLESYINWNLILCIQYLFLSLRLYENALISVSCGMKQLCVQWYDTLQSIQTSTYGTIATLSTVAIGHISMQTEFQLNRTIWYPHNPIIWKNCQSQTII